MNDGSPAAITGLAVAGAIALAVSVGVGRTIAVVAAAATVGDFPVLPPGVQSRIRAEATSDTLHWSFEVALVLLPVTMGVLWWRSKRKAAG
jgi:hypothetical protein